MVRLICCCSTSTARRQHPDLAVDEAAFSGRRTITIWLQVLRWSDRQVWQATAEAGTPYYPAYDSGMKLAGVPADSVSHAGRVTLLVSRESGSCRVAERVSAPSCDHLDRSR